jgi:hypothetical protein
MIEETADAQPIGAQVILHRTALAAFVLACIGATQFAVTVLAWATVARAIFVVVPVVAVFVVVNTLVKIFVVVLAVWTIVVIALGE